MKTFLLVLIIVVPLLAIIWFVFFFHPKRQIEEKLSFKVKNRKNFLTALKQLANDKSWRVKEGEDKWDIRTRISWSSYGEIIRVSFPSKGNGSVEVSSRPKFSKTIADFGKNKGNVKIIEGLAESN